MRRKSLRILYVNSFYLPDVAGGAELTVSRLAEGMAKNGHTVGVFTTSDRKIDETHGSVSVFRRPVDNIYWHFGRDLPGKLRRTIWHWRDRNSERMSAEFAEVLSAFKPDVVSFHNISGVTSGCWKQPRRLGIPALQVLHDLNVICPSSSMFKDGRSCRTRCSSCQVFRIGFDTKSDSIDAVVGVSKFVLDRVIKERLFSGGTPRVIYNAQKLPTMEAPVLGEVLTFGYIGALTRAKGIGLLIDEFPSTGARLVVAGTGPEDFTGELRLKAAGKDIRFLGHVASNDFFRQIDVAIVPSLWNDTLPGVAIEASAYGRPVIASSLGGLPEIVRPGVNGILFDVATPGALREAILSVLKDRAALMRMAMAGRSAVERFLNFDRFIAEYTALYHELVEKSPAKQ